MGEEDGSFRHHQLEEVGALAVWGGVVEVSVWVEWVSVSGVLVQYLQPTQRNHAVYMYSVGGHVT